MVKGKRGWIRIMEAVLAIILVTSILLVIYSKQQQATDLSDYIYRIQAQVLSDISFDKDLRNAVFENNAPVIEAYASSKIPSNFNFEIKICNLDSTDLCRMTEYTEKDVYANDAILSTNLFTFSPKKVRLFIWEK